MRRFPHNRNARGAPGGPEEPLGSLIRSVGAPDGGAWTRLQDKDSVMDWDSVMDFHGARSHKESQEDQGWV